MRSLIGLVVCCFSLGLLNTAEGGEGTIRIRIEIEKVSRAKGYHRIEYVDQNGKQQEKTQSLSSGKKFTFSTRVQKGSRFAVYGSTRWQKNARRLKADWKRLLSTSAVKPEPYVYKVSF